MLCYAPKGLQLSIPFCLWQITASSRSRMSETWCWLLDHAASSIVLSHEQRLHPTAALCIYETLQQAHTQADRTACSAETTWVV